MKRDKYKITDKYVLFSGSFLSNWWPCTETFVVTCNDHQYIMPSSEHYYMFLKAFFFQDFDTMEKIANSQTVEEAKNLGRSVKGFDDFMWSKVRQQYMYIAVSEKFHHCKKERDWLLSPEFDDKVFVEGRIIDNVWGIGLDWRDPLAEDCKNWKGMNLLGRVLNEVREDLKSEDMQLTLF